MKEAYVMILLFPPDGSVQSEIIRRDVIEFDGEEVVVRESSTGVVVPVEDVDAVLESFRREAIG